MSNISAGIVDKATLQDAAEATGNGYTMDVGGKASLTLQVTGTFSGTVTFEASLDGSNWVSRSGIDGSGNKSSTATTTGIYQFNIDGIKYFRARISAYTSGSITVVARATPFPLSSLNAAMEVESLIGEVQAAPTNYTLLSRVKGLADKLDSIVNASNQVKIDAGAITATIGEIEGMDTEGDPVTGKPLTIGFKDGDGNATGVTPTNSLPVQLSGSNIIELMSDMNAIKERQEEVWRTINILTQKQAPPEIFGVKWDKGSVPTLTRTDDAANLTANAGVGY